MDGWMEIFVGCFPLVSSGHQEVFIFWVGYPNLSLLLGVGASRNIMYIYIYIDRCLRFDGFYLSHTYRWCFSNIPYFQPDALRKMIQVDFKERSDGLVQPPTIRFTIRFTNRFIPTSMALWNPDPGAWFFSFLPGLSAAWDTQQPHEHWKHLDGYQLPSICSWGSRKNSQ